MQPNGTLSEEEEEEEEVEEGGRGRFVITAGTLFDRSYYSLRGVPSLLMFPRREATFKPSVNNSDASGEKLRSWKRREERKREKERRWQRSTAQYSYFPLVSYTFRGRDRNLVSQAVGEHETHGGTDSEARRGR